MFTVQGWRSRHYKGDFKGSGVGKRIDNHQDYKAHRLTAGRASIMGLQELRMFGRRLAGSKGYCLVYFNRIDTQSL
jgi:hypothetical protein